MTEFNCECSLLPSSFLTVYPVGAGPQDRAIPSSYPAPSPIVVAGPPLCELDRSLMGRGDSDHCSGTKDPRPALMPPASLQHTPPFPSLRRGGGRDLGPLPRQVASPPRALYAQCFTFSDTGWSLWPQVSVFCFLPCTIVPGWGLVCHPTDLDISLVW